jgi:hypothetical protein
VEQVLLKTAIQLMAKSVQSLVCNLFFVVVKRQPAMSVPLLRMRNFSLVITLFTIALWCDCGIGIVSYTMGHRANSRVNWEFQTKTFAKELNTSALSAAFPEPVGFAEVVKC